MSTRFFDRNVNETRLEMAAKVRSFLKTCRDREEACQAWVTDSLPFFFSMSHALRSQFGFSLF